MLGDLEDLDFERFFDLLFSSTGLRDLEYLDGGLSAVIFIGLGLREPDILLLLVRDLFIEGDMLRECDLRFLV